jgi:putative transposase
MELEWLKKNLNFSFGEKKRLIEPEHTMLSISRQCELLGLSRASYYYCSEKDESYNLRLMNLIDEQFTRTPFYGVERMTASLNRQGHTVNVKRIRRLMRLMGLEAIYPKPRLSFSSQEHKRYPYLLRDMVIDRPDQVWCADITYIRMLYGFIYLVAVMDWFSRYVLAWEISTTLDTAFCVQALDKSLGISKPEVFNIDQGVQFTSEEFIRYLQEAGIRISMDGRGRVYDNIFVERLWRTVKYEEVYLHDYSMVLDAHNGMTRYFLFYNRERLHTSLGNRTPHEVYFKQPIPLNPRQAYQIMHQIQPTFLS